MQSYNSKLKVKKYVKPNTYDLYPSFGFTLVELLVVIGVIALVMGVVFPNFMGARERARDAQRKSDLAQIQNALELYKLDQSVVSYPTTGAFPTGMCNTCWDSAGECSGNIYMRNFPCDPGGTGVVPYIYESLPSDDELPIKYSLTACLENLADPDRDPIPQPTCSASATATSYTVNEP